jgi:hypothetical protein
MYNAKVLGFGGHSSFTLSVLTFMNQMREYVDAQAPSATSVWVCFFPPVFKLKMDYFGKLQISKTGKIYIQVFTLIIKVEY